MRAKRAPASSKVLSMTMLLLSHDHLLRVSVRERTRDRSRMVWRVYRGNRACAQCRALSKRLLRPAREFRARLETMLV